MVPPWSRVTRRRLAGAALVVYGCAAGIVGLQAITGADREGLAALVVVLGFFAAMTGVVFLALGLLALGGRLGPGPLIVGALLSGLIGVMFLTLPRISVPIVGSSFAVALLAVVALVERRSG